MRCGADIGANNSSGGPSSSVEVPLEELLELEPDELFLARAFRPRRLALLRSLRRTSSLGSRPVVAKSDSRLLTGTIRSFAFFRFFFFFFLSASPSRLLRGCTRSPQTDSYSFSSFGSFPSEDRQLVPLGFSDAHFGIPAPCMVLEMTTLEPLRMDQPLLPGQMTAGLVAKVDLQQLRSLP